MAGMAYLPKGKEATKVRSDRLKKDNIPLRRNHRQRRSKGNKFHKLQHSPKLSGHIPKP